MNKKCCNDCPIARWIPICDTYYNLKCSHYNRTVDVSIIKDREVEAPYWCPEPLIESTAKSESKIGFHPIYGTPIKKEENPMERPLQIKASWDKLTPQVEWDSIKASNVYHIPPFMSNHRADILVIYKCDGYFTYRKLEDKTYSVQYCYKGDIMTKVMVTHKTKKVELGKGVSYQLPTPKGAGL